MSYDTKKVELGREPIQIIELDLGYCANTFGVSPCTASAASGSECFNTRATCQDPDNYNAATKTYRFCQSRSNLPIGINMIPSVNKSVSRAPASTTGGKGLGSRAVVKATLNDHAWHDRDVDPYVDTRTYNPEELGTYWGKFLARNPYFENREMRVLTGYLDTPFSWSNFETEYYDIVDIAGPHKGAVTITGKDVLVRTYGNKAKYPAASTGKLLADITDVATSATLSPTGIGDLEYPASGTISIGKEAMAFTRSGDALTLTRAQWGTEAVSHSEGDSVQICKSWTDTNVLDVLEELLVTGAGIPSAYIPNGAGESWDIEKTSWLSASEVTGILMRPEPVDKIIGELSSVFLFDVWWSAKDQEIRVKALSPEPGGVTIQTLTDEYHIIKDSLTIKKDSKQRVSEVQVFYDKIDFSAKDEPTEFKSAYISTDPASTGSTMYGSNAIMTIYSRWFSKQEQAAQLAGRVLARFVDTPSIVSFEIDMKDDNSVDVASRVNIDTKHIQDFTGANLETTFQVTKITEKEVGSTLKIEGLSSSFSGRYWFISPDGIPDYSSANEDQKRSYAFICYDSGVFLDGEEAYKII